MVIGAPVAGNALASRSAARLAASLLASALRASSYRLVVFPTTVQPRHSELDLDWGDFRRVADCQSQTYSICPLNCLPLRLRQVGLAWGCFC